MMKRIVIAVFAFAAMGWAGEGALAPRVFGPSRVVEAYRVLLDRNALLLESISDVIRMKGIRDGEVVVTAGSVQECTYHYVTAMDLKAKNVYQTVKGPFEILNAGGIIADGEPHIHITLSSPEKGAFGGHLEKGCKVLYLGEVTLYKYDGPALTRRANANGIRLLEKK
ncbi:MAG: DNA-binding protein [Bryobacterales bacterium]|nr:DNA-binding protein [Bryobacterales bacterium]